MDDEMMDSGESLEQSFSVKITWSPGSGGRLTESDVLEAIESLAQDVDEEAAIEVVERMENW